MLLISFFSGTTKSENLSNNILASLSTGCSSKPNIIFETRSNTDSPVVLQLLDQ